MRLDNASVLNLHDIIEEVQASLWVLDREAVETSDLDSKMAQRVLDEMRRLKAFIALQSVKVTLAPAVKTGERMDEAAAFRGFGR